MATEERTMKKTRKTKTQTLVIKVWRFQDAPQRLRKLSRHGGDEDWIILVPKDFDDRRIAPWDWWRQTPLFGNWFLQEERLPNGDIVMITAHA
jgi:hypothetical protein